MFLKKESVTPVLLIAVAGLLSVQSTASEAASHPGANRENEAPVQRRLRQIVLVTSEQAVDQKKYAPKEGFLVIDKDLPNLNRDLLLKRMETGRDAVITDRLLAGIVQVLEDHLRQTGYPIMTVLVPPQNIAEGLVRVVVNLGKVRQVSFKGGQWFSEKLLREKLKLDQGRLINVLEMDQAIGWTNNNPFRRIHVQVKQVPGMPEADLEVAVQDQAPIRMSLSADNSGNPVVGSNRYTAALTYGNLWGKDHSISYQHITSNRYDIFRGHGLDYRVPLPWRHTLQLGGSFLRITPSFYDGLFEQLAENVTADLRYLWPVVAGPNPLEVSFAVNFKESNNNLAFGGTEVLNNKVDSFLFTSSASKVIRQTKGIWVFSGALSLSPGEINGRNSRLNFWESRLLSNPRYATGTLSVQRLQALSRGWELHLRALAQLSSTNLLANEQLNLGGASNVRGFAENSLSGDEGITAAAELVSPIVRLPVETAKKKLMPLDLRGVVFADTGRVRKKFPTALDRSLPSIASAGAGVRLTLDRYLNVTADYGWQVAGSGPLQARTSRLHLRGSLSY